MRLKCISEQGSASSSAGGFPLSPNNFHSKWQCAKFELDMTTSDHLVGFASLVEVCLHLGDFFVTRLEVYEKADEEISDIILELATYWDIEKAGIGKLQKICASTTLTRDVDDRLTNTRAA
jgi:hypothetical protein